MKRPMEHWDPIRADWLIQWLYVYHRCWVGCEHLERRRNG
jgi:hypothetical protein